MSDTLIIIISISVIFIILFVKETRRENKSHLLLRIAATLIALLSLALLVLPLPFKKGQNLPAIKPAIFLTADFSADSVKNLLKKLPDSTPVFFTDESISKQVGKLGVYSSGLSYFLAQNPQVDQLEIFGNSFSTDDMEELRSVRIKFHLQTRNGFENVTWMPELKQGELFSIGGSYRNPGQTSLKLVLKSLGTTVDSTEIDEGKTSRFYLKANPKQVGLVTWHLLAINGKDTVAHEPVPFLVSNREKINVLMLFSAPGFEPRFLKNWLEENGFGVAVKTIISKNKTIKEYSNLQSFQLENISESALDSFDVVVADENQLSELDNRILSNLQASISDKGLGLIVLADSANTSRFIKNEFSNNMEGSSRETLKILLPDATANLNSDHPMFLKSIPNTQPLINDSKSRILVNSKLYGSGKLLLNVIPNTFSWALEGNKKNYSSFWSFLLNKANRITYQDENWDISSFPALNNYVKIYVSNDQRGPGLSTDHGAFYFKQNGRFPYKFESEVWPTQSGWQKIGGKQFYIFNQRDWKGMKNRINVLNATHKSDKQSEITDVAENISTKTSNYYVPSVYLLILFSLSCIFLWVEKKLL